MTWFQAVILICVSASLTTCAIGLLMCVLSVIFEKREIK